MRLDFSLQASLAKISTHTILPGLNPDTATLTTRTKLGVVPLGWAGMIVASPNQNLRFLLVRTQKRRDHLLRIIPNTMHYQLLHTPQTSGTAMGVPLCFPRVRGRPLRIATNFDGGIRSGWVVRFDPFTGAGLQEAPFRFGGFATAAFLVWKADDGAGELQINLALDFATADAFTAADAAWAPVFRHESGRKEDG